MASGPNGGSGTKPLTDEPSYDDQVKDQVLMLVQPELGYGGTDRIRIRIRGSRSREATSP